MSTVSSGPTVVLVPLLPLPDAAPPPSIREALALRHHVDTAHLPVDPVHLPLNPVSPALHLPYAVAYVLPLLDPCLGLDPDRPLPRHVVDRVPHLILLPLVNAATEVQVVAGTAVARHSADVASLLVGPFPAPQVVRGRLL